MVYIRVFVQNIEFSAVELSVPDDWTKEQIDAAVDKIDAEALWYDNGCYDDCPHSCLLVEPKGRWEYAEEEEKGQYENAEILGSDGDVRTGP
jgi:hypothetical protein